MIGFTLSFDGYDASENKLEFYDAAQAMLGFQRTLALTTHLVLNGEVITQAPSLKDAQIFVVPPREGSWEIATIISLSAVVLYKLGTAPRETPLGNLVCSAYDYIISETLGFHVDYEKTLGKQYEELSADRKNKIPLLDQSNFDSVIEKCEKAVRDMHRPIVKSTSAERANIYYETDDDSFSLGHALTSRTYEYINETIVDESREIISGKVSSYNINTYKGRIYIIDEKRPVPFELSHEARNARSVGRIVESLRLNAIDRKRDDAIVSFRVYKHRSVTDRLKSVFVLAILNE
ncbi:DUF7946 domain-containing protein [Rhodobium gokarnense]|uniref:Uncharacterized protein n=1 Tax=Rhodobium gokarnense TaxID=364296 RepID=A0ABT3H772_9HYPH|nr:hypothetical protein [Rhodobium gokarnense]MCW2306242.1 hypothetical protein [Rhodobium gokarnense]